MHVANPHGCQTCEKIKNVSSSSSLSISRTPTRNDEFKRRRNQRREHARAAAYAEERRRIAQILLQAENRQKKLDSLYLWAAIIQSLTVLFVVSSAILSFVYSKSNIKFFVAQLSIEVILLIAVSIAITSTRYACRVLHLIVYIVTILYDVGNISTVLEKNDKNLLCRTGHYCFLPTISLDSTTLHASEFLLIFHVINFFSAAVCCAYFEGSMDHLKSTGDGQQIIRNYVDSLNANRALRNDSTKSQPPNKKNKIPFSSFHEHAPTTKPTQSPLRANNKVAAYLNSLPSSESVQNNNVPTSTRNIVIMTPVIDDTWSKILKRESQGITPI
ncbi:unnamed protein product [Auanema sp. JU1783]|nr:unnamed protein product [Auanema sp. JU1783]